MDTPYLWEANLYHFYIKVYNRLIQVLPHPIMIKDGIQQEETPAHDAIREALINCIIRHYRIFCVNGKYGIQKRVPYFLFTQNFALFDLFLIELTDSFQFKSFVFVIE